MDNSKIKIIISQLLINYCLELSKNKSTLKRFGCEDVEIGFRDRTIGNKKEFVDYMVNDIANQSISCYVIRPTINDVLTSDSINWVGNHNYLVITRLTWENIGKDLKYFDSLIPNYVGIVVADIKDKTLKLVKNTTFQARSAYETAILKDSLTKALFVKCIRTEDSYKNVLKSIADLDKIKTNYGLTDEEIKETLDYVLDDII